jgi:hypothetical protein
MVNYILYILALLRTPKEINRAYNAKWSLVRFMNG